MYFFKKGGTKLATIFPNSEPVLKTISYSLKLIFSTFLLFVFTSAATPGSDLEKDVLKYTNDYRSSKGLKALVMRDDLNTIARKHSDDMASGRSSFGHEGYDKRAAKVKKIFATCTVAENVAYGARNAKEVFTIWKNSSGHRKNMLGNYKYVGIGTAKNKSGVIYYT